MAQPGSSTVEVDLEPHPDGTLVRLVHRDPAPEVRPLHAEGWARFLPRQAAVVVGRDPLPYPTTRPNGGGGPAPPNSPGPRRSRGHRHPGRDRRRPPPRTGRRLPARPGQRPPLDRRAALGPTGHRAAGRVGSQVERVASFLGRHIEYVNEISGLTGTRLAMRSVRSPFPMRVTYGFDDTGDATTEVSVPVEATVPPPRTRSPS